VLDANGLPTGLPEPMNGIMPSGVASIDWSSVPAFAMSGSNYVQVVIERMCDARTPVPECMSLDLTRDSHKHHDLNLDPPTSLYYRVTVRTHTPGGTASFVQAIITYGSA